jgi:nucleotide-binding universal stress UspA family protein
MEPMNRSTETMIESYLSEEVLASLRDKGVDALKAKITKRIRDVLREELVGITLPQGEILHQMEPGKPSQVILKVAKEITADLIVMGTRTHSSIGKLLMGSTAQKVLQESTIPVLVVPLK